MLEIRRTAIGLNEKELLELEQIITGGDEKGAFLFLKKAIYDKTSCSQHGKLKLHLDTGNNPVERFIKRWQRVSREP